MYDILAILLTEKCYPKYDREKCYPKYDREKKQSKRENQLFPPHLYHYEKR